MRVLLDTHALVWAATTPERLGSGADLLAVADVRLVSAVSIWELAIKQHLGKLSVGSDVRTWTRRVTSELVLDHLGEVAGQRALVAAAQLHLVAVPEDDAPEAVPLRLVEHALGGGHLGHGLGQHRLHRRQQGQVHAGQSSSRGRRPERADHDRHRFGRSGGRHLRSRVD